MEFTTPQLEILSILWSSETPLSLSEIAERTKYRFAASFIVRILVGDMLAKKMIYKAGSQYNLLSEENYVRFSPAVRFEEYYLTSFREITPSNLYRLTEKLLQTKGCLADRFEAKINQE